MIRRLRRRHLRTVAAVALVAPPLAVVAVWLRPAPALVASLPAAVAGPPAAAPARAETVPLSGPAGDRLRLTRAGSDLRLEPIAEIGHPELLAYWSPGGPSGPDLPEGAELLGLHGGEGAQTYALGPARAVAGGELLLYSLGHREVVARAVLAPWPAAAEGGP